MTKTYYRYILQDLTTNEIIANGYGETQRIQNIMRSLNGQISSGYKHLKSPTFYMINAMDISYRLKVYKCKDKKTAKNLETNSHRKIGGNDGPLTNNKYISKRLSELKLTWDYLNNKHPRLYSFLKTICLNGDNFFTKMINGYRNEIWTDEETKLFFKLIKKGLNNADWQHAEGTKRGNLRFVTGSISIC